MTDTFDAALEGVERGRRSFLKKMVMTTAFAAPVVSSFTMTGIKAVYAQTPLVSGAVSGGTATTAAANTTPPSTTTTTMANSDT